MWYVVKPSSDQARLQWVADLLTAAEPIAGKLGVTPEAIVAQAAQETGWGAAKQGRFGLFGEKVSPSWTGLKVLCPTREWNGSTYVYEEDWFRDFNSYAECLAEHFQFLDAPRWHDAGVWDKLGDEHFFEALKRGGYATDPNYAENLMRVENTINDYYVPLLAQSSGPPPAPVLRVLHIGDVGSDVSQLQDALQKLGYYKGAIDGSFGKMTYDAVVDLLETKKIGVDGVVGNETRGVL